MTSQQQPAKPFRAFLSYSHSNEAVKDRLKIHLAPLKRNGWLDIWDDRDILAGADWRAEIGQAMAKSDVAIFLLNADFLASDFCMDVEVAAFLERHDKDGTLILFLVSDHCSWDEFNFIKRTQLLPRDARPIIDFDPPSEAYTAIAKEIKNALAGHQPKSGTPENLEAPPPAALTLPALLARLPGATNRLFGREAELKQLDEWRDHKGVILWVADGGTGKSALLRKWLETQNWPAGTRFIGHSFYSQGSHNQTTSARGFLIEALKALEVAHEANASDDELGRLLAEEAAKQPTVIALDGMEPLQQASDDPKLNGTLKDGGLSALLEKLARAPGQALCLASSRMDLPECTITDGSSFRSKTLKVLPPTGAQDLLRQRGVRGSDEEIAAMADRCGFHPLALVLAAEFCHTYLQDSAPDFLARPWQPQPKGHAATVMTWFDDALGADQQQLDRELARILGLFDRPAPWGALMALKAADPIPGVSERLHDADDNTLFASLARLSQWGLLDADLTRKEPDLDAHPLVREHFGKLLEEQDPAAWRAAHNVLFEWFCGVPEEVFPDTLEGLEPLYRAVGHGCKAGRYVSAGNAYFVRITRLEDAHSTNQLGAYSSDLSALAGFFPIGWVQLPVKTGIGAFGESLTEENRSLLMASVAFCLMAIGELEESVKLYRIAVCRRRESGSWKNFCVSSQNLSDSLSALGRWEEAQDVCKSSLDAASNITDSEQFWRAKRIALADWAIVRHCRGDLNEAHRSFALAELFQAKTLPDLPLLKSLSGYGYNQLLLEQAGGILGWQHVCYRGEYGLEHDSASNHQVSLGLHHCIIGIAQTAMESEKAEFSLNDAVSVMKRAGRIDRQPPVHLARAQYLRTQRNFPAAWEDHEVAYSIARRGNMRTYLAECALLAGNLHLDEGDAPKAAAQYAEAAQLIREDGYGRREAELRLLHTRVLHAQHDPGAPAALAAAEARIRETGQWFFWRELRAVAKEIGANDPGECPAAG